MPNIRKNKNSSKPPTSLGNKHPSTNYCWVPFGYQPLHSAAFRTRPFGSDVLWSLPRCRRFRQVMRLTGAFFLVGGWATHLKNMKVSWDNEIPNWMGKKWGSKAATSFFLRRENVKVINGLQRDGEKYTEYTGRVWIAWKGCFSVFFSPDADGSFFFIWKFPKMEVPQDRWFTMENSIENWNGWFRGTPIYEDNPHLCLKNNRWSLDHQDGHLGPVLVHVWRCNIGTEVQV